MFSLPRLHSRSYAIDLAATPVKAWKQILFATALDPAASQPQLRFEFASYACEGVGRIHFLIRLLNLRGLLNLAMEESHQGDLPRLARHHYQGHAVVMWNMLTDERATGWLDATLHLKFRELLLHAAAREMLFCPAYCLMPDHLHLVWMGLRRESDQLNAAQFLRKQLNRLLAPLKLQSQAHDHVLREAERRRDALAKTCFYILANPVRAELVAKMEDWPFSGAVVPGYPTLNPFQTDDWEMFWKIYVKLREAEPPSPPVPPLSALG